MRVAIHHYMLLQNVLSRINQILATHCRLNVVTVAIIFTVLGLNSWAFGAETSSQHIEIGLSADSKRPHVQIAVETLTLPSGARSTAELVRIIADKSNTSAHSVVVSTDNADVLEKTVQSKSVSTANLNLIPIDTNLLESSHPQKKSKFSELVKTYLKNSSDSARSDKIGVVILTYTTAAETLVWIHSTQLNQFERTGNVVYTIALALVFGLNKDAWTMATRPIQKFFRNILKPESDSPANLKELAARFLGNLTLAAVVTSGRIPLMSMESIIEKGIQLQHFTMPLLLTIVSTSALFTWSEHLAMIDAKSHPITKFVFRRANEIRTVLIGTFATTAALLNPGQYGSSPWIAIAGIGVVGSLLYFNADSISSWVENNKTLIRIKNRFAPKCHIMFVH